MSWRSCPICNETGDNEFPIKKNVNTRTTDKITNFHEQSRDRQFKITLYRKCEKLTKCLNFSEKRFDFYIDLYQMSKTCIDFEKYKNQNEALIGIDWCCNDGKSSQLNPVYFHAFLEASYPTIYGIRPVPISSENIVQVLNVLGHFKCEPLLTNCERYLMKTNISQLNGTTLAKLLSAGLSSSLDHKILSRILCVCLMNSAKLSDASQELVGTVGSVFAQAFVANASKSFRHVKPIEEESVCQAVRNLIKNNTLLSQSDSTNQPTTSNNRKKKKGCDHNEESFECILCFDTRCTKCKGEAAFCYKALDNFLYEVRLQLYPETYRGHLDRELLREDCINNYILRHQLLPLPNQ